MRNGPQRAGHHLPEPPGRIGIEVDGVDAPEVSGPERGGGGVADPEAAREEAPGAERREQRRPDEPEDERADDQARVDPQDALPQERAHRRREHSAAADEEAADDEENSHRVEPEDVVRTEQNDEGLAGLAAVRDQEGVREEHRAGRDEPQQGRSCRNAPRRSWRVSGSLNNHSWYARLIRECTDMIVIDSEPCLRFTI